MMHVIFCKDKSFISNKIRWKEKKYDIKISFIKIYFVTL